MELRERVTEAIQIDTNARSKFWSNVERRNDDECWRWLGWVFAQGYGGMKYKGLDYKATHISLFLDGRPRAIGMVAMHSCDNRICVNPAHLSWGTVAQNNADMWSKCRQSGVVAANAELSFCKNGHEFTPNNTRITSHGSRRCRTCERAYDSQYKRDKRAMLAAFRTEALGESQDRDTITP